MDFLINTVPREYQQKIFQSCIDKNCLVILPTGLGKTLIALMLTIERIKKFPGEKVVFLAPTKPLAEQHLNYFKKHLPELFGEMQLFTGEINASKRKSLWETSDIIFSTPQCVANDVRKNLYSLKEVSLLIEDEAHRCVKNYDYNIVAKTYAMQANNPRILGLTASPGSDMKQIREICRNLSIETVESRTRDSPDVKEYLQELESEKVMVDFPPELLEIRNIMMEMFNRYVSVLKKRSILFEYPSKTNLIKLQKKISMNISKGGGTNFNYLHAASECAQAIKIQHALELLETQTLMSFNKYLKTLFEEAAKKKSKGVIKLVANPEFNFCFVKSNELLTAGFEHPKLERVRGIVEEEKTKNPNLKIIIFSQFRETAKIISEKLNTIEGIKSKVFIGQASKTGSEGLSQKEQKRIIENFSSGEINILCATSIGEEGLDIPEVNIVIFYETVPSAIRKIQRGGRTARLIEGKIITLITKGTRDEAHFYVSRAREKKMNSLLDTMKDDMLSESKRDMQKTL